MKDTGSVPLAAISRGGCVDNLHRGAVVVCDRDGSVLFSAGDPGFVACVRSSNKILQAFPVLESGTADKCGFDDAEIALVCASHPGREPQQAGVRSMLAKAGLPESALKCGPGVPDNCSGKHTGMLATAKLRGEPLDTYLDPNHPHQQRVLAAFCDLTGLERTSVRVAVDGCGAPTFFVPIRAMARALARIATPETFAEGPHRAAATRIARSMCAHPEMTGEPAYRECLAGRDVVLSKSGGNGFLVCGVLGKGIGAAMKIEDGAGTAMRPVLFEALRRANAIPPADADALIRFTTPKVLNRNQLEVGEVRLVF